MTNFAIVSSLGLRCVHLHLLCAGDGGEDGGSWDFRPPLLPGRHLEPAGLLHCHGWVSENGTRVTECLPSVDCFMLKASVCVAFSGETKQRWDSIELDRWNKFRKSNRKSFQHKFEARKLIKSASTIWEVVLSITYKGSLVQRFLW